MTALTKYEIARRKLGRMSPHELALLALSKHPQKIDCTAHFLRPESTYMGESTLLPLRRAFADFDALIAGKDVIDFGCGDGYQTLALKEAGARTVLGVDIAEQRIVNARALAGDRDGVRFDSSIGAAQADVVISLDAFEHFEEPQRTLAEMRAALRPGGRILLCFGPLWLSPYGAHMRFFSSVPWMNILFPERAVMRVRSLYRDDERTSYEQGLNRMTTSRFEQIVAESGLEVEYRAYSCPQGARWAKVVPLFRELLISHIDAVLRLPAQDEAPAHTAS